MRQTAWSSCLDTRTRRGRIPTHTRKQCAARFYEAWVTLVHLLHPVAACDVVRISPSSLCLTGSVIRSGWVRVATAGQLWSCAWARRHSRRQFSSSTDWMHPERPQHPPRAFSRTRPQHPPRAFPRTCVRCNTGGRCVPVCVPLEHRLELERHLAAVDPNRRPCTHMGAPACATRDPLWRPPHTPAQHDLVRVGDNMIRAVRVHTSDVLFVAPVARIPPFRRPANRRPGAAGEGAGPESSGCGGGEREGSEGPCGSKAGNAGRRSCRKGAGVWRGRERPSPAAFSCCNACRPGHAQRPRSGCRA